MVASRLVPAQSARRAVRIGLLDIARKDSTVALWQIFRGRLQELGYAEGKNLVIEERFAQGAAAMRGA